MELLMKKLMREQENNLEPSQKRKKMISNKIPKSFENINRWYNGEK